MIGPLMRITARRSMLCCLVLLLAGLGSRAALATEFELARLAAQLNLVSGQLAHELRYARGYGNLRLSADRLSREAAQLVDAIRRGRSPSYIRSQFKDVSRRYLKLEEAFLSSSGGNRDASLFNGVGLISDLYASLSNELYYTQYLEPVPPRYYYDAPYLTRRQLPSGVGRSAVLNSQRQQAAPERPSRLDYGRIRASQGADYDHRSSVLDRQARNNASRNRVESISNRRHSRSTDSRRRGF